MGKLKQNQMCPIHLSQVCCGRVGLTEDQKQIKSLRKIVRAQGKALREINTVAVKTAEYCPEPFAIGLQDIIMILDKALRGG